MTLKIAPIALGGGAGKAWKVTFDADKSEITIGYGTLFYNGKLFTSNDLTNGSVDSGIGTNTVVSLDATDKFIYITITNPLSLPTEPDENLAMSIKISTSSIAPDGDAPINTSAPLIEHIPLAFVDADAKVFDLRPAFWVDNFSFLA